MNRSEFEELVISFLSKCYGRQKDIMCMSHRTVYIDYCYEYFPQDVDNAEICAEGIYLAELYDSNPSSVPELDDTMRGSAFNLRVVARRHVIARHESER